jgi:hypothetical protein
MRKPLRMCVGWLGLGLLAAIAGCQTWHPEAGLTLPSPEYLQHPPQFIPQSPEFPLPRETESLSKAIDAYGMGPGLPGIK